MEALEVDTDDELEIVVIPPRDEPANVVTKEATMIATVLGLIFVLIILGVIFWGAQQLLGLIPLGRAVRHHHPHPAGDRHRDHRYMGADCAARHRRYSRQHASTYLTSNQKGLAIMVFYVKSETEIIPVEKPPEGELPPLVIWGPGDPRPYAADSWLEPRHRAVAGSAASDAAAGDLGSGRSTSFAAYRGTTVGLGQPAASAGSTGTSAVDGKVRLE